MNELHGNTEHAWQVPSYGCLRNRQETNRSDSIRVTVTAGLEPSGA